MIINASGGRGHAADITKKVTQLKLKAENDEQAVWLAKFWKILYEDRQWLVETILNRSDELEIEELAKSLAKGNTR